MITIDVVECGKCGYRYFSGEKNITLRAGNERQEPDELYFAILKVARCHKCKAMDRTMTKRPKKR